ncbi:MAG: protein-L-isoaspartate O-methyltransferase [Proteobacteria bacterium]|nr:protein-L-isoaspartate O-methyltransferase [Pseudomonadota bacterium]
MRGWIVPPPKEPTKSKEELKKEREKKIRQLSRQGVLKSKQIREAMLRVSREDFIPHSYRDYAYLEVPLPLPGEEATISCPHSYPLFYEPLGLDKGHRFLEIGLGSGYGTALAREIVGAEGLVVSIEIDPLTFEFGKGNLKRAGYTDIILVRGDGGLGHRDLAPYDRACMTAACLEIPHPVLDQLKAGGRLIAPLVENGNQNLILIEKKDRTIETKVICQVLYVYLRGRYGAIY